MGLDWVWVLPIKWVCEWKSLNASILRTVLKSIPLLSKINILLFKMNHRCGKEEWCANTGEACVSYPCCEATQCITFQMWRIRAFLHIKCNFKEIYMQIFIQRLFKASCVSLKVLNSWMITTRTKRQHSEGWKTNFQRIEQINCFHKDRIITFPKED